MFIVSGSYIKPIDEVERVLPAHKAYLDTLNEAGILVCCGPMKPRTGGVILLGLESREMVDDILKDDPFNTEEIVEYSIIEFIPNKAAADLQRLLK
ncbi:MAG: YciI family protein [Armatimonadota bacterium]|nr:YciI family protein [bacterium]